MTTLTTWGYATMIEITTSPGKAIYQLIVDAKA